jgi:glycosyltransferase involved in cell wall biosynthesis
MISVVTATYETSPYQLIRLWESLKEQTHTDWEWIIHDDSPTENMEVFRFIQGLCTDERYHVGISKPHTAHGRGIGNAKKQAFGLASGDILVELDHDDELMPTCLEEIAKAFEDPEVGFVYSDWAEVYSNGEFKRYSSGWGLGYGTEYYVDGHGWVMSMPTVNKHTLAHIVAVPNHVRAWRNSVYHEVGGHNPFLRVCDDYDLLLKTALATKMQHIPKFLYKQHVSDTTAQREFNTDIQELVPVIHACYAKEISIKYPD